jgi:hypothetical protein
MQWCRKWKWKWNWRSHEEIRRECVTVMQSRSGSQTTNLGLKKADVITEYPTEYIIPIFGKWSYECENLEDLVHVGYGGSREVRVENRGYKVVTLQGKDSDLI